jgi:hypothetical protein
MKAQTKKEAGFFVGTSYYLGDINPTRQFYDPSPSFGGLFKYYFNSRHCLRFSGFYGQFRGSDRDFSNEFQQLRNKSFSATLFDVAVIYEFNFLPYQFDPRKTVFSPFIFGGIGYDFVIRTQYPVGPHLSVPFGLGVKYMASRKVTLGLEWSFRKTFQDNIDGVESPGGASENSFLSNKDWYSFAGFFITFRLFDNTGDCPVYSPEKR